MRQLKPAGPALALWLAVCGFVGVGGIAEQAGADLSALSLPAQGAVVLTFLAALIGLLVTRKHLYLVTTYTVEPNGLRRTNNRGAEDFVAFEEIKAVKSASAKIVVPSLHLRVHLHSGEPWDISWQAESKRKNPEFEEFGRVLTERVAECQRV